MASEMAPAPMEGHGSYNKSSRIQASSAVSAVAMLEEAAKHVVLPSAPTPIVIADYGSSQGANSIRELSDAIALLRSRAALRQGIQVFHTDLPTSDYTSLFVSLATDSKSYVQPGSDIYAAAVGRSFYEQILPSRSVTLGWSSWAVQWLSRAPMAIPDQVQVAYSHDALARAAFAEQADADWRTFLRHRSNELHAGGRLVVVTMGLTAEGEFGYRPLLEALYESLRDLADSGFMDSAELHGMVIPTVGRSLASIEAPFAGGMFNGLVIEQANAFLGDDPLWAEYERDGDAGKFAHGWAAFTRASVLPTLGQGLSGGVADARYADFLDRAEAGMAARLSAKPEKMVVPLVAVVLRQMEQGER
jgi:hypothetical protein